MTLVTGSEKMVKLLNRIFELLNEKNEDVLKFEGEHWSTFKSRKEEVGFAYLQPQVNGIKIFPKLPCEILKSLNINTFEIRTMERAGSWGKTYKC